VLSGGLPEAGLGVAAVCPVQPIEISVDDEGTPCWDKRRYPKQYLHPWVAAIKHITQRQVHADISCGGRRAAHAFLAHGEHHMQILLEWIQALDRN